MIAMTVFLSVLAHGVSAAPLAARYGRSVGGPANPTPTARSPTCRCGGCRAVLTRAGGIQDTGAQGG